MSTHGDDSKAKEQFGVVTKALAGHCHTCKICAYADRKPDSAFGRLIHWHRGWCPAWAAHAKVHGPKESS